MRVERIFILYEGAEPGGGELQQVVEALPWQAGVIVAGARVTVHEAPEAGWTSHGSSSYILLLQLQDKGEVPDDIFERTFDHIVETAYGWREVVLVTRDKINYWVREAVLEHLAKFERAGLALTERPAWARLTSEPVLEFVAGAWDSYQTYGYGRSFNLCVIRSMFPDTRALRVRKFMGGGYLQWVDSVFRGCMWMDDVFRGDYMIDKGVFGTKYTPPGKVDIAHWLVCESDSSRAVHLAYLPADETATPLLPRALLSEADKNKGTEFRKS